MSYLIVLLSVTSVSAMRSWYLGEEQIIVSNDVVKWIEQPLDHFDNHEKRTWQMKYTEDLEFWKQGGPIFFYAGGESRISKYDAATGEGPIKKLARETNAAIFVSEHRYYGDSIPLNMTVVDNLKYLSSEQALADLAYLIKTIKLSSVFKHSKVAVFGCSYSGTLAAWMKVKYPDIVDAAWASSAPVLAKKDNYKFFKTYANDLKRDNPEKYKYYIQRYKKYGILLQTSKGIKQLKKEENICDETNMEDPMNKASFIYSKLTVDYSTVSSKVQCRDYEIQHLIDQMFLDPVMRPWFYQVCTEFGFFATSKPYFTNYVTLDFYLKICSNTFGPEFNEKRVDEGVAYTNRQYGGLTPNVTNIAYVYGDADSWRSLGILKSLSDDAVSVIIPHGHHCQDLVPSHPNDPIEITEARKYASKLIKKWLDIRA